MEATIKNTPIEDNCGAYMVVIGKTDEVSAIWYKPENLPEEFKLNDLKVKITYSLTDKKHNCGFGGYKSIIESTPKSGVFEKSKIFHSMSFL